MITQIQLRGISRDPSDRMNSDGGCAESLNVQLNNGELAPTPSPDETTYAGLPTTLKVLYLHKTNSYTNYIGRIGSALKGYVEVSGSYEMQDIAALGSDADPDGVTSIGNILVWTTASGTHYALFRDDEYTYLGDSVPEPMVTFRTYAYSEPAKKVTEESSLWLLTLLGLSESYSNMSSIWNKLLQLKEDRSSSARETAEAFYNSVVESLWETVNSARTTMRGNGVFEAPVMARYALKMFSGDYLYISAPVILTGSVDHDHIRMLMNYKAASLTFLWNVYFPTAFTADVRVDFGSAGLWADLIESVDIFISQDIYVPPMNAKVREAYETNGKVVVPTSIYYDAGFEMDGVSDYAWLQSATIKNRYKEDFETEMLNKGNFYKIASIPAFTQAYWEETLKPKSQDDLVVLPRLSEGDSHSISGLGGVGSYNERLILTGEKITLSKGNQRPDALLPVTTTDLLPVSAYFYIRTEDGSAKIVEGYRNLNIQDDERARAYVTYPDPRCYQAVYYLPITNGFTRVVLPMKEHPRINASYGFWGLGLRLDELVTGDTRSSSTVTTISETEDRTYTVENRLFLSEMDDPFVFPLGQRITFSSKILDAVPITIPLSTGQFGQYQLYVFTEEGIWAETITDEGKIAASAPVSRDVPLPGSVCQLDQSVVFASKQGVMMISGASAQNISPDMLATRDVLGVNGTLSNLGDWTNLMTIAQDGTTFLAFLDGARFVYDYPGKRFLMFNPSENYAYIFKLDTGTWHKQQLPAGKTFSHTLNSYPNALVSMSSSGSMSVVDFATVLGGSDLRTALVITRNLNLGESDVRKMIKGIKIRGEYRSGGSAQYILMGSMDGKYFNKLTSLKNGSWKFYKIALLLKLYPDERVSWIDVDYESRFTNKLR